MSPPVVFHRTGHSRASYVHVQQRFGTAVKLVAAAVVDLIMPFTTSKGLQTPSNTWTAAGRVMQRWSVACSEAASASCLTYAWRCGVVVVSKQW